MIDHLNPYQAPHAELTPVRRSRRPAPGRWLAHGLGVMASIWGLAAWIEWVAVPWLVNSAGGPVPYLAFGPQAILLFLGCVVLSALVLLTALLDVRLSRLLYAIPSTSYVVFQVWRIL